MKRAQAQRPQALQPAPLLAPSNRAIERDGVLAEPGQLWVDWIWKSNPEEPFEPGILLNRSHLLGLLACRHMAGVLSMSHEDALPAQETHRDDAESRMVLVRKPPREFTLRELKDSLDNLLIEWPQFVERLDSNPRAAENLGAVAALVDGCFARLGHIAQRPADARVFNDPSCTEPHAQGLIKLSRPGLRRLLGSFLVLYRHLDVLGKSREIPVLTQPFDSELRKHHVEASTDDFHLMCMHTLLPVAAKLNYKQDFPGMYNHVSQVIYFHNSKYERTPRATLEEILSTGDPTQAVPAIAQIFPDIDIAYEEDHIDLTLPTGKWRWLVFPRRIYLVDPNSNIFFSKNALSLLHYYKTHK